MARRKRPSSKNFKLKHPREIGKFYRVSDSNGGHPARVYYSEPDNDVYFIQRFTTNKRKDRVRLLHNIDPNSNEEQWLAKRPEAVGYDDMVYIPEYDDFRVHPDDYAMVLKYQKYNLTK